MEFLGPPVLANAGASALMIYSALLLFFGTLVIGFVEGLIVARLLRACRTAPAVAYMVVVNYISMCAGLFTSWFGRHELGDLTTAGLLLPHLRALGALFLVTLAIETPAVFLLARGPRPWRRAIRASLVAQVVTYAVLVAFYVSLSSYGWVQHTTPESEPHFVHAPTTHVYFRSEPDGPWWRVELGAPASVREALGSQADAAEAAEEEFESSYPDAVRDLRPEPRGPWTVRVSFWGALGLLVRNEETGSRHRLNLETPLMSPAVRYVTVLPGDQVVLALGRHIYVLDLPTRRLAHIAKGHAPYVVLPAADDP